MFNGDQSIGDVNQKAYDRGDIDEPEELSAEDKAEQRAEYWMDSEMNGD